MASPRPSYTQNSYPNFYQLYKSSSLPSYSDFRQFARFNQRLVKFNGYQPQHFIAQCSFDNEICSWKDFHTFQHPHYGNCFTFNSIRSLKGSNSISWANKTGKQSGLKVTLFVDIEEYLGLIHDKEEYPRLMDESVTASAGETTFVLLSKQMIVRYGGKYSRCSDKWPHSLKLNSNYTSFWPQYSQYTCKCFCSRNQMAVECGCTEDFDTFFSDNPLVNQAAFHYCNHTDPCRADIYDKVRNGTLTCDCPPSCRSTKFNYMTSHSVWPPEAFTKYLLDDLLNSSSTRIQHFAAKLVKESGSNNSHGINSVLLHNFVRLEVYMGTLNCYTVRESPSYEVSDLLSDFGNGKWKNALSSMTFFAY